MLTYEEKYKKYNLIAGMDEAGRGPLAGPVCVACVIMPLDNNKIIEGINDSKKLTEKKREELFDKIIKIALDYSIEFVDAKQIDDINILNATKLGMQNCVKKLRIKPDVVLIDAVKIDLGDVKSSSIIKGDSLSYNIAAASILAKVSRDRLMVNLHNKYPEYNFKKHKGYGTAEHKKLLIENGPCDIHRNSFIRFLGR